MSNAGHGMAVDTVKVKSTMNMSCLQFACGGNFFFKRQQQVGVIEDVRTHLGLCESKAWQGWLDMTEDEGQP